MADGTDTRPNMDMPHWVKGPTVRAPFWPPLPRQSKADNAFSVMRVYSASLVAANSVLNQQSILPVRFEFPVTLLAATGSATLSDGSGFPVGMNPLDSFTIAYVLSSAERITVDARRGGGVVGTGSWPFFFGGSGWPMGGGTTLQLLITPVLPGLAAGVKVEVDINLIALETRFGSSIQTSVNGNGG